MIYINQINQLCRDYRIRDLETSDEDADEADEGKLNKGKEDHQEAEEDVPIGISIGMLVTIIKMIMIMMMTMMARPYISMAVIQPLVGGRFVLSTKPKPTVTTASTWRTRR